MTQLKPPIPVAPLGWWRRLTTRIWGYDFFISYHWISGGTYAVKLVNALRERGFDCFLDRSEFASGDDWKEEARQALTGTRRLIVVGTPEALSISKPVHDEVAIFTARSERVIPILFGGRIPDDERSLYPALELISERVVEIIEDSGHLESGPSKSVLDEIERSHKVLRRRRLRTLLLAATIVLLATAAIAATVSYFNAESQRRVAERALVDTQRELARSLIDRGVRDARDGNRIGLLRMHRAYEIASRSGSLSGAAIPADQPMNRTARRLMAGWQARMGLGLMHENEVARVVLSPDGEFVRTLTLNIDGEPQEYLFWEAGTGRSLGIRIPVDDAWFDLEMSPDWSTALYWDGTRFKRWDLRSGQMRVLQPPPADDPDARDRSPPIHSVDGRWSATLGEGSLSIWDQEVGQPAFSIDLPFETASLRGFSSNSRRLLVLEGGGQHIALIDIKSRQLVVSAVLDGSAVIDTHLSARGDSAALILEDKSVVLIDAETAEVRARVNAPESGFEVRFSPDGGSLLLHGARIWRVIDAFTGIARGEIQPEPGKGGSLEQKPRLLGSLFSFDGKYLAITDTSRGPNPRIKTESTFAVWEVATMTRVFKGRRHAHAGAEIQFSSDGSLLVALDENGFEVFESRTGHALARGSARARPICHLGNPREDCRFASFSPDGRVVMTSDYEQRLAFVVQTVLPERILDLPEGIAYTVLSPDASRLATFTKDSVLQLWNVEQKALIDEAPGPVQTIDSVQFARDPDWLITEYGSTQHGVYSTEADQLNLLAEPSLANRGDWILSSGGTLVREQDHGWESWYSGAESTVSDILPPEFPDYSFAFSATGRRLAATDYGENVTLWDTRTGEMLQSLDPRGGGVSHPEEAETAELLVFSNNAKRLLTVTSYGTARIWEVDSGRIVTEIAELDSGVRYARFSPDAEVLASMGYDGVQLWDVDSGFLISNLMVNRPASLAFSADGRYLYVSNRHATYRFRSPILPDEPDRLRAWITRRTLAEWSEQESPVPISRSTWEASWDQLTAAGGPIQ